MSAIYEHLRRGSHIVLDRTHLLERAPFPWTLWVSLLMNEEQLSGLCIFKVKWIDWRQCFQPPGLCVIRDTLTGSGAT